MLIFSGCDGQLTAALVSFASQFGYRHGKVGIGTVFVVFVVSTMSTMSTRKGDGRS